MEVRGISTDGTNLVRHVIPEINRCWEGCPEEPEGFGEQGCNRHRFADHVTLTAKGKELLHQVFRAFCRVQDFLEIGMGRMAWWHVIPCQLRIANDHT